MPFINADRIKETTITTGTGNIALAGAVLGFRAFYPTLSVGDTFKYFIVSTSGTEWEAGLGTLTASSTLARTTIQSSSNANAAVVFTAGLKEVGIGPTAGGETPWNPVSGTLDISVNALNDVAINSPTVNQVLKYSGTEWTNQADAVNAGTVTSVSGTGTVSGLTLTGTVTSSGSLTLGGTLSAISLTSGVSGTLPIANGGTNAITAAAARTSLGLVIGTDVLAPTGSAANLTSFPTLNQNTTGNAATVTTNANLTGHITSVGNAAVLGSFTSAQLATALTDETGTGANVFATSPTLVTPLSNTLSAVPVTSGAGNSLTIAAGSGVTSGAGGSLILQAGLQATSGGDGKVIVKQVAGQTSNLQEWQDSSGSITNRITRLGGMVFPWYSDTTPSGSGELGLFNGNGQLIISSSTSRIVAFGSYGNPTGQVLASNSGLGWNSGSNLSGGNFSIDCGFRRNAAGVVQTSATLLTGYCSLIVGAYAASYVGLKVLGAASQTANLQEWQDSSGTALASVDAAGTVISNALAAIPVTSGLTASVTAASSSGGILTYTATNTFTVGRTVSVTGLGVSSGTTLNIAGMTIATASSSQFTVVNATVGVSSGTGTATAGGNTIATSASNAVTAGSGGNYTITAGSGVGVGKGGDIILQPGPQGSSGGNGWLKFVNASGVSTGQGVMGAFNDAARGYGFGWDSNGSETLGTGLRSSNSVGSGHLTLRNQGFNAFSVNGNDGCTGVVGYAQYSARRLLFINMDNSENTAAGTFAFSCTTSNGVGCVRDGQSTIAGGSFAFPSATTAIAANTNDLVLTGSAFQRLNCTSTSNLTGIAPPSGGTHVDGRMIRVYNVGTANLTLTHNSGLSTTANRFWNSTAADIVLAPNDYAELIYDITNNGSGASGWRAS